MDAWQSNLESVENTLLFLIGSGEGEEGLTVYLMALEATPGERLQGVLESEGTITLRGGAERGVEPAFQRPRQFQREQGDEDMTARATLFAHENGTYLKERCFQGAEVAFDLLKIAVAFLHRASVHFVLGDIGL